VVAVAVAVVLLVHMGLVVLEVLVQLLSDT
jgi:hypothetical protein